MRNKISKCHALGIVKKNSRLPLMLSRVAAPLRRHMNTNFVAECTHVFHVLSSSSFAWKYYPGIEHEQSQVRLKWIRSSYFIWEKIQRCHVCCKRRLRPVWGFIRNQGRLEEGIMRQTTISRPSWLNCTFMQSTCVRYYPQIMMAILWWSIHYRISLLISRYQRLRGTIVQWKRVAWVMEAASAIDWALW